jgi:hypothetical protein
VLALDHVVQVDIFFFQALFEQRDLHQRDLQSLLGLLAFRHIAV